MNEETIVIMGLRLKYGDVLRAVVEHALRDKFIGHYASALEMNGKLVHVNFDVDAAEERAPPPDRMVEIDVPPRSDTWR